MDGYKQKKFEGRTKRYVQFLELASEGEAREEYIRCHSKEVQWKEVRDGIREVGILEMEIYIRGRQLVMIVEAPEDFDWDAAMAKLATLPRQAEWEAFVSKAQGCPPDARSDEKWQMAERMFYLYD